jgi:serine/threonine-protein kinase
MNDETPDPQDRQRFELLDQFVRALHSSQPQRTRESLRQHPELIELLDCVEALECLALPTSVASAGDIDLLRGSEAASLGHSEDFGKYELRGELGRGGMGVVYRAWQKDLGRMVALKMILSRQLASEEEVRRFYREAEAAGRLRHPHIVGIHEVGQIHGQHYFSMDYVAGQSLAELLRGGPLAAEAAAQCLLPIARAVDYLHQQYVVHRDLKPSNILLDEHGDPSLTDFGLARIFETDGGQTQSGCILGTPSYMAPEQAAGRTAEISARSDVYSLGAILYEMLTGRPPFQEKTPLDTLVQVLEGEPTPPAQLNRAIPHELEMISLRCLEKNPADRYQSAAALAADLDRFLKGEPIETRSSSLRQAARRWMRRQPALASRLGGLTMAAGIIQVRYLIDGENPRYHLQNLLVLGVWAIASFLFQRLSQSERYGGLAAYGWCTSDASLLTMLLVGVAPPLGPLLIAYPLLVVTSGMFFRVPLVCWMTALCVLSYAILMSLRPEEIGWAHYPIIFGSVLIIIGWIVSYQVYRVRVLSRYYDHRLS